MITTVTMSLRQPDGATEQIKAFVHGPLCIHLDPLSGGLASGYRVSHVASGLYIACFSTRKYALLFLRDIAGQDWSDDPGLVSTTTKDYTREAIRRYHRQEEIAEKQQDILDALDLEKVIRYFESFSPDQEVGTIGCYNHPLDNYLIEQEMQNTFVCNIAVLQATEECDDEPLVGTIYAPCVLNNPPLPDWFTPVMQSQDLEDVGKPVTAGEMLEALYEARKGKLCPRQ